MTIALSVLSAASLWQCMHADKNKDGSSLKDGGAAANNEPTNADTMFSVLYEVQVRAANACRNDTGSPEQKAACAAKIAPTYKWRAKDWAVTADCGTDDDTKRVLDDLGQVRLGTLEDMIEQTDDYHVGVTLKYIKEKVGANTVWVMPVFPNNDQFNIPAKCDNLGSPYAVRDYMHVAGSLSRVCIKTSKTEFDVPEGEDAPCYGNVSFDAFVAEANKLGIRVMMDIALNHFGHNYKFYDYADFKPIRERIAAGENIDSLWDFNATYEDPVVKPNILDTLDKLKQFAIWNPNVKASLDAVTQKCPDLKGDALIRAVNMYRNAFDWERAKFSCTEPMYLEYQVPGFYAGSGGYNNKHPAKQLGDNYTNNWSDVKFLYHQEIHGADSPDEGRGDYYLTFVRNREYFFHIINYWVSRGVQGFRFDHSTDGDSGMAPNEWRYLMRKVNHYDWVRKGKPADHHKPIYLVEDFGDQQGMNQVADAITDGSIGDMRGGNPKDTAHVQDVLQRANRFNDRMLIMRALEDHDERRLFDDTGFNEWTGAGFWGVGATTHSLPMILMGQEFGEKNQLSFRRSEFLRSRFYGSPNHFAQGQDLVKFYGDMIKTRLDGRNHALLSSSSYFLPLKNNAPNDPRIFAEMKWWGSDVVFAFHNLWDVGTVEQTFYIPQEQADQAGIKGALNYKLVNALNDQQLGPCHTGDDLKTNLYVKLDGGERLQWLRLELCN